MSANNSTIEGVKKEKVPEVVESAINNDNATKVVAEVDDGGGEGTWTVSWETAGRPHHE